MKMMKLVCLILGLSLLLLGGNGVSAPVFGIEVHGLYAFNFDRQRLGGFELEPDAAFGGGATLVICPHPNFKLDLGADYLKPEGKGDQAGNYIQLIPVTAGVRAGVNLSLVFLYGGGGIGYSFNELDLKMLKGLEIEDGLIYFACGGAELALSGHFSIRSEFRYNWLEPELKSRSEKADWSLDHMEGRVGMAFYF